MPLDSSLIEIQEGDRVEHEDGRKGTLLMIKLVPNNNTDWPLIAMLKVKLDEGNHIVAASTRFHPVNEDGIYYKECYPSGMLFEESK